MDLEPNPTICELHDLRGVVSHGKASVFPTDKMGIMLCSVLRGKNEGTHVAYSLKYSRQSVGILKSCVWLKREGNDKGTETDQ